MDPTFFKCFLFFLSLSKLWSESMKQFQLLRSCCLKVKHDAPQSPLCENITSSIKPEIHNISQRGRKRTEPRPQSTRTENLETFCRVVSGICKRRERNRQTHILMTIFHTPPWGKVITKSCLFVYLLIINKLAMNPKIISLFRPQIN